MNTPPLKPVAGRESLDTFSVPGVIATNDSATETKIRAAQLGYYEDPFASKLGSLSPGGGGSPLMHRGYYARVRFVQCAYERFKAAHPATDIQVVSLGCGFDSTFFRVTRGAEGGSGIKRWIEVDFPAVIEKKRRAIDGDAVMKAAAKEGDRYRMVAADLRDCDAFLEKLKGEGLADGAAPTLIVSECVLIYLRKEEGDAVVAGLAGFFDTAAFVTYEMIRPDSLFGAKMVENLRTRRCPLLSIHAYPTLASQELRYKSAGFPAATARDMNAVWAAIPASEKARVNRIEMMDELEEWNLIHSHYCFVCSAKGMPDGWTESLFA
ncbi:putative leucine carboxyl methyltransferase 1 [Diplonema papillatum]|nr:putative leucine carboxyl methyltransferase 1 [Diplonema papillatum]